MNNVVFLKKPKPAVAKKERRPRRLETASSIRAEANILEHDRGKNAYSDYLRRYERRPDRQTAITIGRLINARVRADDGKLYPPLTVDQRADLRRHREEKTYRLQGYIAACAILELSQIRDPAAAVEAMYDHLALRSVMLLHLAEMRMDEIAAALRKRANR